MKTEEQNNMTKNKEQDTKEEQGNHMALGICFGMMAGSVGMSILSSFGETALGGLFIPGGMFIGMVIGMLIPKKK